MIRNTLNRRLLLLYFILILFALGGFWSVMAQDSVLPLPGSAGSRAFTSIQELTASDGAAAQYFGLQVALDGDTLLEGSNAAGSIGSAYIFERDASGIWNEVKRLSGSDSASGDDFAYDIALDGNTAVVGAPGNTAITDDEGALFVFTPNGAGVWTQSQKLFVPNTTANSYLGNEVDIDGDRIIAAAEGTDKAYIFKRDANQVWQLETDLDTGQEVYDVKIKGDTVLIGAASDSNNLAGAAYLYQLQAGSWTFVKKLTPSDGATGDSFGSKLLLHNDQALVFALLALPPSNYRGAVYVFSENGGAWTETQKIVPNDPADNDIFGYGMAADDETLVISSYGDNGNAGSAYQFGWNGSTWVQQDKILPVGGRFGTDVDFQGDLLVSGAPLADNAKGRVYVYSDPNLIPTPTPEPVRELLTDGGFENNAAGWDVKDAAGDKVKCNKEGKSLAHSGNCAWRFKGGAGENSKIQQTITSGVQVGDTLTLSGFVRIYEGTKGNIKVIVKYLDPAIPNSKIIVDVDDDVFGYYAALSESQPVLTTTVTSAPEKVKVIIKNNGMSNNTFYDTLSLIAQ